MARPRATGEDGSIARPRPPLTKFRATSEPPTSASTPTAAPMTALRVAGDGGGRDEDPPTCPPLAPIVDGGELSRFTMDRACSSDSRARRADSDAGVFKSMRSTDCLPVVPSSAFTRCSSSSMVSTGNVSGDGR
mgnify:FL=1